MAMVAGRDIGPVFDKNSCRHRYSPLNLSLSENPTFLQLCVVHSYPLKFFVRILDLNSIFIKSLNIAAI